MELCVTEDVAEIKNGLVSDKINFASNFKSELTSLHLEEVLRLVSPECQMDVVSVVVTALVQN